MSFDIFLQGFTDGVPAEADAASIRALLEPVVVSTDGGWAGVETSDGGADIYGYDNVGSSFMINHATGNAIWDLIVAVAAAGRLAIMPAGCPACVTDASLRRKPPSSHQAATLVMLSAPRRCLRRGEPFEHANRGFRLFGRTLSTTTL